MPRRANISRSTGGRFPRSNRKTSVWAGSTTATPIAVASGAIVATTIVSAAVLQAIGFQGYIARTRGRVVAVPDVGTEDPVVTWAVGVFSDNLTTFPGPSSQTREPYFAWGTLFALSNVADSLAGPAQVMEIDSKGKRRFIEDQKIVMVVEGAASGHAAEFFFDAECLLIPDQGA